MPIFCGMNYKVVGEGPPVLLLHGWGASGEIWNCVVNDLKNDFAVYTVDFLGFGKSEKPNRNAGVLDYVACIARFCEEIVAKPCIVVGHSFGGRVAIVLTALLPKNVTKLVLVDSAGLKTKLGIKKRIQIAKYRKFKKQVISGKLDKSVLNEFGSTDYKALDTDMKKVFVNVVNFDLSEYAKKINKQTLLFWGKNDKDTPLYMAKRLKRYIKNSKLVLVRGGHYSFLDNPNIFLREFYRFV